MFSSTLISILAIAGLAFAHGFPKQLIIDGTSYPGANGDGSDASKTPIRAVSSGSPVTDVTSGDMACGNAAQLAAVDATAKPGSNVQVTWQGETGIPWFHNTGPILTYMAKCDSDCKSFTPSASTQWFKISELGEKEPGTPNTWIQADLNSGAPVNVTIPSDLAAGNYLMRQEIIALQNGQTQNGAEFYPSCIQLTISGGRDTSSTPSPTVNFPGAYTATDAGILGNFYNPGVVYSFPGGPVANIASGSSGSNSGSSSSAPAPSSAAPVNVGSAPSSAVPSPATSSDSPAPTATEAPSSSGSCKKKRSNKTSVTKKALNSHKKRRIAIY